MASAPSASAIQSHTLLPLAQRRSLSPNTSSRSPGIMFSELRYCGVCFFPLPLEVENRSLQTKNAAWLPTWKATVRDHDVEELRKLHTNDQPFRYDLFKSSAERGCVTCAKFISDYLELFQVKLEDENGKKKAMVWGTRNSDLMAEMGLEVVPFEIVAPYKHGHPFVVHGSRPSGYTGSDESMAFISSMLLECNTNHAACARQSVLQPKRLLSVRRIEGYAGNTSISVRLEEGVGPDEFYACLSHRWGSSLPITLQTSNKSIFEKNIPWVSLPQLFKDAIMVIVYLNLRYLWIDCLCIIQDDMSDWKVEATSMSSIYQNSTITISATSSRGSDEALFSVPSPAHWGDQPVAGIANKLTIRKRIDHPRINFDPEELEAFPLLSRGWVYQERLLSPRTIHFNQSELLWECREVSSCECMRVAKSYNPKSLHHKALIHSQSTSQIWGVWRVLVGQFSVLDLTYKYDRLTALAGIAQQLSDSHASLLGTYLGGLWENQLDTHLTWKAHNVAPRPSPKVAPTWSWASVSGPVSWWGKTLAGKMRSHVKIVEAVIEPTGRNVHGSLKSGLLKVEGFAVKGTLEYTDIEGRGLVATLKTRGSSYEFDADYRMDKEGGGFIEAGSRIWCLRVSTGSLKFESNTTLTQALILHCVDPERMYYERVGLLEIFDEESLFPLVAMFNKRKSSYLFGEEQKHAKKYRLMIV